MAPSSDVAKTVALEQMSVDAPGEKNPPTSSNAPITSSDLEKHQSIHPLATTQSDTLAADLVAQWTLYAGTESRDPRFLDAMIDIMEKSGADVKYGPHASNEAILHFFDYDEGLSEEWAEKMMTELKATNSSIGHVDPALIVRVHQLLCEEVPVNGGKVGNMLPYNSLGFFIEECQSKMGNIQADDKTMQSTLNSVLATVENHNRHMPAWTSSMPSGNGTKEELLEVVAVAKQLARVLQNDLEQSAKAFVEENGGLLKHKSVQSLMAELSLALDRDHIVSLFKQVARIWSTAYLVRNKKTSTRAENLCKFLDEATAQLSTPDDGENDG